MSNSVKYDIPIVSQAMTKTSYGPIELVTKTEGHSRGGTKHDSGKVDLSILPLVSLELEAKAFMFGEKKYGRYNYTQGFESSRLVAAALRHIHAYNSGEDFDQESGVHHLGHARACLSMLLHCDKLGTLTDNRYKKG